MARTTIHQAPPKGSGLTPCCKRPPFELPLHDRMTAIAELANCRRRPSTSTASFVLGLTDDDGEPLAVHGTIEALVNDVVQAVRTSGRAQHVAETETMAQAVAARLSLEWMQRQPPPSA